MKTLKSKLSSFEHKAVVDVVHGDLMRDDICHKLCDLVTSIEPDGAVLNLQQIEVLTSDDFLKVTKIVSALEVIGLPVMVCGINPQCALVISAFIDDIPVRTELDVKHAVQSF